MKAKFLLLAGGVVACAVGTWFSFSPPRQATAPRQNEPSVAPARPPATGGDQLRATPNDSADARVETPAPSAPSVPAQTAVNIPKASAQSRPGPTAPKEPLKDPVAREALAFVGLNPEAEAYWAEAINDPGLSAHERQDLIEDLNEDGISDSKHPTIADLPVILNRLELIEVMAPNAMDSVNWDAFMEAYKDLVNLANVAVGGGEPVR